MPGEVAITEAFDLEAKYIIHASGPWWQGGEEGEALLLKHCFDNSLQLAWENGCRSIAFPLLATGTYGFPKRLAIEIAVHSFRIFLQEHDMEIMLVVFGNEAVNISGELVDAFPPEILLTVREHIEELKIRCGDGLVAKPQIQVEQDVLKLPSRKRVLVDEVAGPVRDVFLNNFHGRSPPA